MKHVILKVLSAFALAWVAFSVSATSQIVQQLTYSYTDVQYATVTANGTSWLDVSYNGIGTSAESGAPILPCQYVTFSVPYNAVNIQAEIIPYYYTGTVVSKKVLPLQDAIAISDSTNHPFTMDSTIYLTNAYYPSQLANIVSEGYYMGENHIVTVAVCPLEYNPVTNHLRVNLDMDLILSYDLSNDIVANDLLVSNSSLTRGEYMGMTGELVVNPDDVEDNALVMPSMPNYTPWQLPEGAILDSIGDAELQEMFRLSDPSYLIVSTAGMEPSFKRIKALKRQKGYKTCVVNVEDILADERFQNGDVITVGGQTVSAINDDAGKIRQYLKRSFRLGTRFVLLGGKNVPFRYANSDAQSLSSKVPTDLYYSDLTYDWTQGYGTAFDNSANLDYHPELYVGRLMSQNEQEISNYSKKLLRYELNPGNGNTSYLQHAFFTQCQKLQLRDEANYVYSGISDVFPNRTLIEQQSISNPKGETVMTSLRQNPSGFISFHGHGCANSITVNHIRQENLGLSPFVISAVESEPELYGYQETGNGLDMMRNPSMPGILYTVACTTIPYDNLNNSTGKINMGESFTLGEGYGGVAYLGNTRSGYMWGTLGDGFKKCNASVDLETLFLSRIKNGSWKIGIAEAESKLYDLGNVSTLYSSTSRYANWVRTTHNLLGDPEVEMWTSQPQSYSGIMVSRTDNSITVSGISSSGKAYVGLCCNEGFTALDSTSTGSVTFTGVLPNSTVMVYQHNYLPFIAPLSLQNTVIKKSQYVLATDVIAGNNVDNNRTAGDVVIRSGVDYEIEHSGKVVLAPGFKVKKGARFATTRSDYR